MAANSQSPSSIGINQIPPQHAPVPGDNGGGVSVSPFG
jgi:hypothetical protein